LKTSVQKWGNSLAVRIPKSFAGELGLAENAPVAMTLEDGALLVRPERELTWDLGSLLARVTDENLHPCWEAEGTGAGTAAGQGEDDR
jgi:antitoxin MazE